MIYKLLKEGYFPKKLEENVTYIQGYGMKRRRFGVCKYLSPNDGIYYDNWWNM